MKKINLQSLTDANDLSWVLDRALFLLSNSPANLRLSQLSQATGVPPSSLTRMKNLHVNPQYEPFVNQHLLFNLLRFVLQQFPTLVLGQGHDGNLQVRLYKSHAGFKLGPLSPEPSPDSLCKRNAPKPGSTRWFLDHQDQEGFAGAMLHGLKDFQEK